MARSFEQIYANAPKAAVGRLLAFRHRYAPRYEEHHSKLYRVWEINDTGSPETAVVFLPSAMGHGEIWFPYMLELRNTARLLSFSLADDEDPAELAAAFWEILERNGVMRAVIVGQSIGGLLAQIMASQKPERTAGLALMLSGSPSADIDFAAAQKWELRRKMKRRLRFRTYSPAEKLGMANQIFDSICPEPYKESSAFWLGYIEETFAEAVYKAQHIAVNTALGPNIYSNFAFTKESFKEDMPVLIAESQADNLYLKPEREAQKALFPSARIVDVGDAGQFTLQLYEQRVCEILSGFLKEVLCSSIV